MTSRITAYAVVLIAATAFLCATAPLRGGWERRDGRSGIITPRPNPGRYNETAWYATPSNTSKFSGGYLGGGAVIFGDPRRSHEGTWGWDYDGVLLQKRIWLNWFHGRRYQDGGGQYEPDGPKVLHRR